MITILEETVNRPYGFHTPTPSEDCSHDALRMLYSTAISVGMTLHQLSAHISQVPALSKVLSERPDSRTKLDLATNLFEIESKALLKKSMILAGFRDEDVREGSRMHVQALNLIYTMHGQQLSRDMSISSRNNKNNNNNNYSMPTKSVGQEPKDTSSSMSSSSSSLSSSSLRNGPVKSKGKIGHHLKSRARHRHVHRRGKCGHKAILHRPPGKPAHIDFVVGGMIECFEGIPPLRGKGEDAEWLSSLFCEETVANEALDNDRGQKRIRSRSLTDLEMEVDEFVMADSDEDVLDGLLKLCDAAPSVMEI